LSYLSVSISASSVKSSSEQPVVIPVSRLAPYGLAMVCVNPSVWRKEVRCQSIKCIVFWSTGHRCFWGVGLETCGTPVTHLQIEEGLWGKSTPSAFADGGSRFPDFPCELARPQAAEDGSASPRRLRLRGMSSDEVARELARHTRTAQRVHGDLVLGASRPTRLHAS